MLLLRSASGSSSALSPPGSREHQEDDGDQHAELLQPRRIPRACAVLQGAGLMSQGPPVVIVGCQLRRHTDTHTEGVEASNGEHHPTIFLPTHGANKYEACLTFLERRDYLTYLLAAHEVVVTIPASSGP